MSEEVYGLKDYFRNLNLADSRIKFRERVSCMTSCRMHFPSDPANIKALFECTCGQIDNLNHWKHCIDYAHLSEKVLDWNDDVQDVNFYRGVIKSRDTDMK